MARRLEHLEAARDECLRLGATFTFDTSGKHITVTVGCNGQVRKTFLSKTPSDWRVTRKVRAIVRNYIAEMRSKSNAN